MTNVRRREFLGCAGGLAFLGSGPGCVLAKSLSSRANGSGTGYVYDARMLEHQHYTERPERLTAIADRLSQTGLDKEVQAIAPEGDPLAAIKLVHTDQHIEGVSGIETTGRIASLAVSGVLRAIDAVCGGKVRNAFCAIRPPGHHAHNFGAEEGFCFYSNVAIAAKYAQTTYSAFVKKVLIIDWDFHHGNGTQDVFYTDPSVLFFSTHDWRAYPMTGNPTLRGEGAGLGYNINAHMEPGSGDDDFVKTWEQLLLPVADTFKPDLVLISAGFDSKRNDLLGSFDLTECGFARLTRMAMDIADSHCNGRVVSVLEGGYADADTGSTFNGLANSVTAHVKTLVTATASGSCSSSSIRAPRRRQAGAFQFRMHNDRLFVNNPSGEAVSVSVLTTNGRIVLRSPLTSDKSFCVGQLSAGPGCFVGRVDRADRMPDFFTFDHYRE